MPAPKNADQVNSLWTLNPLSLQDKPVTELNAMIAERDPEFFGEKNPEYDTVEEAIAHIYQFGSGHTESIVTEDKNTADLFQRSVDSSCVMVNASTRLHDGGVFGFGSEIGISTNKLHARGTMGLRELTTTKYLVNGNGQIRK